MASAPDSRKTAQQCNIKSILDLLYEYIKLIKNKGITKMLYDEMRNMNIEEMTMMIKQNTRRYAKRQLTWFRRDARINWINAEEGTDEKYLLDEAIRIFNDSQQMK